MKKCENEGCDQDILPQYTYCYEHYKSGNKTDMTSKSTGDRWADDPIVDQLMKINNNLGKIVRLMDAYLTREQNDHD